MLVNRDISNHSIESRHDESPVLEPWVSPEITSFLAAVEAQGGGSLGGEGVNNVS
jgi:hypothetical protein